MRKRPLWRCPKCGWRFANRKQWHSCVRVPLAAHFKGKNPMVRKTFDALVAAVRQNGPVTIVGSKTRIAFMVRMRFAAVTPKKEVLRGHLMLMRRVREPRFFRVRGSLHEFRLVHPKEIDRRFRQLLAEAYKVGQQKNLRCTHTTLSRRKP